MNWDSICVFYVRYLEYVKMWAAMYISEESTIDKQYIYNISVFLRKHHVNFLSRSFDP